MKMLVIQQLQFKEFYSLVKLFEYVHGANSLVGRVLWPVFEGNVVRLFSELFSVCSEAIVFVVDPYYYVIMYLMIQM